ncbi:unnamed protein product [Adineta steineri]|uniref:Uncharacterized protein n=1 Tax=Adineta steineri TaxID=433720 RepID=A0A814F1B2_9BILA|nr:unnamed protein product [Adineta steineri]CAF1074570.1 unnamed protein product [Adineta steineri]CAF3941443.1 unnamed protein product [Adineta steineri]
MAMAKTKTQCSEGNKKEITYPCKGCSKEFCLIHLTGHQQILHEELNHIINDYDQFKERINEQKQNPQNDLLIEQINQWERISIEKIQQKAKESKEIVIKHSQTLINDTEIKFNYLTEQIKQTNREDEFNEIDLNYLRNQLMEIIQEFNNPSNISLEQGSKSFINEISILLLEKPKFNKWNQNTITVAGGNGQGQQLNQLYYPHGILIDKKKNIFIADNENNRAVEWKCNAKKVQIIGARLTILAWPVLHQANNFGLACPAPG